MAAPRRASHDNNPNHTCTGSSTVQWPCSGLVVPPGVPTSWEAAVYCSGSRWEESQGVIDKRGNGIVSAAEGATAGGRAS